MREKGKIKQERRQWEQDCRKHMQRAGVPQIPEVWAYTPRFTWNRGPDNQDFQRRIGDSQCSATAPVWLTRNQSDDLWICG